MLRMNKIRALTMASSSEKISKVLLFVMVFILPLGILGGRFIYVKIDQKNVYTVSAKNYLPQENVEISVKKLFNKNYDIFCFITSYFEFHHEDIDSGYLSNAVKYSGSFPRTFATDEGEWGLILIKDNKMDILEFRRNIMHPDKYIINSIKKIDKQVNSSLICSYLELNKDLIIKLRKRENKYEVVSFSTN